MECKSLYKNNFVKPGTKSKAAADLYHKTQRQQSRHEIRQSFRNMHDSDEENDAGPPTQNDPPPRAGGHDKGKRPKEKAYCERLNRLLFFRELRKMQKQQARDNKGKPFIPVVSQSEILALAEWEYKLSTDVLRRLEAQTQKEAPAPVCPSHHKPAKLASTLMSTTPGRLERVASGSNGAKKSSARKGMTPRFETVVTGSTSKNHAPKQPLSENNRTPGPPVPRVAHAASRVDCWRRDNLPPGVTNRRKQPQDNTPAVPLGSKKAQVGGTTADPSSLLKGGIKKPSKPVKDGIRQKPLKALENVRPGVPQQSRPLVPKSREFKFTLKPTDGKNSSNPMITSTIRKLKKPLPFSITPSDGFVLNVPTSEAFFDGISPIEIETPLKEQPQKVAGPPKEHSLWEPQPVTSPVESQPNQVVDRPEEHNLWNSHPEPVASKQQGKNAFEMQKEHSLWVPQPVALSETLSLGHEIVIDSSGEDSVRKAQPVAGLPVEPSLNSDQHPERRIGDSFWEPQPVASLLTYSCVGGIINPNSNDGLLSEAGNLETKCDADGAVGQPKRKPSLNESYTISDDDDETYRKCESNGVFGQLQRKASLNESYTVSDDDEKENSVRPKDSSDAVFGCRPTILINDEKAASDDLAPLESDGTSAATKRRSSKGVFFEHDNPSSHCAENSFDQNDEKQQRAPSIVPQKRCSLLFVETTMTTPVEPSDSNILLQKASHFSGRIDDEHHRSCLIDEGDLHIPQDVRQKTNFYYGKVECERNRLEELCNRFEGFLESEELNDHCKGLILAAQGQSHILINKKLTKFRELIGHYETKWDDRKVRHDDLDGFWQMVSLDLENLDKRFAELHRLKDNNWEEEPVEEDPPKVKKLQAGGGVRKRERKGATKTSSAITDLIRKAREEQRKQKKPDLGPLADTVKLVTTPVRRSLRIAGTPKRNSILKERSIVRTSPTEVITGGHEGTTSPLTASSIGGQLRGKSVLFIDLDTPEQDRRRSTRFVVDTPKPNYKLNDEFEDNVDDKEEPQKQPKRRSLSQFTEENDLPATELSKSNLRLDEKIALSSTSHTKSNNGTSSGAIVETVSRIPEEVKQKTVFYNNKVDSELQRLEALCNDYVPFLGCEELSDHCKGLILAAQGQTNILINKKLTKFRELIGHYETKWDDRKVRHDDLDGFWLMVSLDLENLDKRFAELHRLMDNNWEEESVTVDPPKVRERRARGGVYQREKKPATKPSSAIADLIRKARREQQNQNIIQLEPLAETVMSIASPVKLMMPRIGDTPKRSSILNRRSSICKLCSPDLTNKITSPSLNRRNAVLLDPIKADVENVKRGSKTSISGKPRGGSVLFIDDGLETPKSSRRSTRFVVDTPKPNHKLNDQLEDNVADKEELQKQPKRRSLSQFTEENDLPATELSESNLRLDEKISLSLVLSPQTKLIQRPSSVATIKSQMPEEVKQKTVFYNNKVDSELRRLEALCNDYVPFLGCEELNDHCKGLILAAQGQTNILINKKLTKFRELIGHYETKWDDRKVRHDDLDGFWQMVSLDLDNLDQRFAELHRLKDNNWEEEPVEEDPPKVKKLQAGGGVRKREKKPAAKGATKASSAIADLIRKVRKDQQKQNAVDLGPLSETVNLIGTPIKRSSRRNTENSRCNYDSDFAPCVSSPAAAKRYTIFPGMNPLNEKNIKSILKTPSVARKESRSKSVLFVDTSETPQAAHRQSSRLIVATPKPKLTFSDQMEFEHIDNLDSRTPSRLDGELHKRRQQSLLTNSMSTEAIHSSDDEVFVETPRRRTRTSRALSAIFSDNTGGLSGTKAQVTERSAKRNTRASSSRAHIET